MEKQTKGRTVRATFSINYELRGEPHHPDEIVEKLNEAMGVYFIPSDNASSNPRWTMEESYREIILSGM